MSNPEQEWKKALMGVLEDQKMINKRVVEKLDNHQKMLCHSGTSAGKMKIMLVALNRILGFEDKLTSEEKEIFEEMKEFVKGALK